MMGTEPRAFWEGTKPTTSPAKHAYLLTKKWLLLDPISTPVEMALRFQQFDPWHPKKLGDLEAFPAKKEHQEKNCQGRC